MPKYSNKAIKRLKRLLETIVEQEALNKLSMDASWNKGYVSGIRNCINILETETR